MIIMGDMARPKISSILSKIKEKDRKEYKWWQKDNGKKLQDIEYAYRLDCTDEEACNYIDIPIQDLYYYQRNIDPDFVVKKYQWKNTPFIIARQSVIKEMKANGDLALKYLERKRKDEFSTRQESTGKDGKPLIPTFPVSSKESQEELSKLYKAENAGSDSADGKRD